MDGAVGLTQGPIRPSTLFIYKFNISADQAGTFWLLNNLVVWLQSADIRSQVSCTFPASAG